MLAAGFLIVHAPPAAASADLAKAAAGQNGKKVQRLLESGAAVDEADDSGRTALFYASAQGDVAMMEQLAAKGAAIDPTDKDGVSPLIAALRNPVAPLPAIQFLLGKGADINRADKTGRTPLMEAVLRAPYVLDTDGQVALVRALLAAGADPARKDATGAMAVHHAAYVGEPRKVLEVLLAATPDPNATTVSGANVLMMAAQNGQRANVDFLLAKGYRPTRIKAVEDPAKPVLAQDQSPKANALAEDWWGQHAARKGDAAAASAAFSSAAADYDLAAAEAHRLVDAYGVELTKDKKARAEQRLAAGIATVLTTAATFGAGYTVVYMPMLRTKVEEDERAIALFGAEAQDFTARAASLRAAPVAN